MFDVKCLGPPSIRGKNSPDAALPRHVWLLDQYAQDAEREGDQELASLFRRMQEHSRKGAEECRRLLHQKLGEDA